ncbi:MAG: replication-associated recombination protein A [Candidatus Marinimicrobia bacterium]|jgi:putative ATPase|nr:replication-associated recombination protein A [Candidatus Neomarinimicrobiota bacterium]MBT3937388.1 replication-associated recombination protein A [Candidatus Neomarinimicrobiota bacterium]MBT3960986.1 replication-associated recombination protein A [Candidatus Neomarinimicrobiota bacterium]MBT4383923.1 replication-associated recombination protein A [Candidatus Neomarinimicrobiota bacterium]MBT4636168.1 replication-associated recombination protein A [Candidatus Neomarinimicrobiota bacterium
MNRTQTLFDTHLPPLADRLRPTSLNDYKGQSHLVGNGKLLRRIIEEKKLFSMIFWGPPGTGKTTLARIIAQTTNAVMKEISAVSSGVKDLRTVISMGNTNREMGKQTLLFIDEIHRFNKSQQDALLHAVEEGTIILIGATTENPSFEVISPLLSRCRVLTLRTLEESHLESILGHAFNTDIILSQLHIKIESNIQGKLIQSAGGDARKMLNTLDVAVQLLGEEKKITDEILSEAIQSKTLIYDKTGDYHYDTISAFIKSVRGSDPDAAIYWLAVMLEGGEKPEFIARRLIILASEDIGNADPNGLIIATSAFQAVHVIGMPEAAIILGQITTYLASAPKSNASYNAINQALKNVKENGTPSVPLHLRNAPTELMKNSDYGKDYKYPHSYPDHFVNVNYLPEKNNVSFYRPSNQGHEKWIKERLKSLWGNRFTKK